MADHFLSPVFSFSQHSWRPLAIRHTRSVRFLSSLVVAYSLIYIFYSHFLRLISSSFAVAIHHTGILWLNDNFISCAVRCRISSIQFSNFDDKIWLFIIPLKRGKSSKAFQKSDKNGFTTDVWTVDPLSGAFQKYRYDDFVALIAMDQSRGRQRAKRNDKCSAPIKRHTENAVIVAAVWSLTISISVCVCMCLLCVNVFNVLNARHRARTDMMVHFGDGIGRCGGTRMSWQRCHRIHLLIHAKCQ